MLFSDLRYDFVRTWLTRLDEAPFDRDREDLPRAGGRRAATPIASTSVEPQKIVVKRAADMRYVGQEHAVTVDLPLKAVSSKQDRDAIKRPFDEMHELRYGTSAPQERAEIVSLRATVTGVMRKPPQAKISAAAAAAPKGGVHRQAHGLFDGSGFATTPTYRARRAARRQPHQGAGADRGACLDHGADAGRRWRSTPTAIW